MPANYVILCLNAQQSQMLNTFGFLNQIKNGLIDSILKYLIRLLVIKTSLSIELSI